jgi:type I restriction enzyme S subunit
MELMTKQGYKQTEVGLIPEDWETKSISEISNPVRGGSPRPAGSPKYFNGDFIPWLTVASLTNIPNSQIFVNETKSFLTEAGSHLSRKLEKGTLIIANSGATLGVAKLLGIRCCANDGVAALQDINKNIYPIYLVYYINTITKRLREDIATGNGQPNLNTELIGNIKIPLPPTLTEQKAIATALSDVDALISSLEQGITKKKAIKQGAMQELLTGKTRLKGFEGSGEYKQTEVGLIPEEWSVKPLKNMSEKVMVGIASAATHAYRNRGIILFRNQNIKPNFLDDSDVLHVTEEYEILFKGKRLKGGDLLTARTGYPGTTCVVPDKYENSQSFTTLITRPIQSIVLSSYLSYYINSEQGNNFFERSKIGGGQKNVNAGILKFMPIPLPPTLTEQKAIAHVLSDMDAEIAQLEAKKAKYQAIKQGMMQELLTGKTRLV